MAGKPPDNTSSDAKLPPGVAVLTIEIPDTLPPPPLSEREALDCLLGAMEGGAPEEVSRALDTLASPAACRTFFLAALRPGATVIDIRTDFHLAWTVRGFRLREALDDDGLLLAALRVLLPPYEGEGLSLFRGEQAGRYAAGKLGFGWTPKRQAAEMFASGLCASYDGGGVLLEATAPAEAIIAGPSAHSGYLGEHEHVVDPSRLTDLRPVAWFPQN
ncbi:MULTISPECIES: hypothetical protein [unclassified Sphingomonas]|uniref:hypothetical protein n=1 Tax=unclassified Sphingomonas TaxID=196159 RepID=UPI001ACA8C11|nr:MULTISPECIES: hypothetical protein [unclassified Sphingomonas]MBN8850038.1 hypothetical protein [Sphingomonas sp.]